MQPAKVPKNLRFQMYRLVEVKHKSVKEVCESFGVSRKNYYKWYGKDHAHVKKKLWFEPNKRHPDLKLTKKVQDFIYDNKVKYNLGPKKMKMLVYKKLKLIISTTIIYRYYKKKRLIRKPQKKLPWYEPLKQKLTITRPGEGVQIDVKYVYERSKRKYKFSVFDPYTELYFFMIFDRKLSLNAITALQAAGRYFGFKILSVQTDNGSEFRGDFHTYLTTSQVPHYFIPKKSPWWNGKVERVHRTIDEEYYHNPHRIWKTPYQWLKYYNYDRIHLSLNGLTPHEMYLKSVTLDC